MRTFPIGLLETQIIDQKYDVLQHYRHQQYDTNRISRGCGFPCYIQLWWQLFAIQDFEIWQRTEHDLILHLINRCWKSDRFWKGTLQNIWSIKLCNRFAIWVILGEKLLVPIKSDNAAYFPIHSVAASLYWSHQQWPNSYLCLYDVDNWRYFVEKLFNIFVIIIVMDRSIHVSNG